MPIEFRVAPCAARELLARYFGDNIELMRKAHVSGYWGSHVLRAVLGIALEDDLNQEYDLVPRLADELLIQPQQLASMEGGDMPDAARMRAEMALFDARRLNNTENPSLSQFVERWR